MRVLFVTVDAGGNLPPALGVASALQRRGHAVTMLGHAPQRAAVEAQGLAFEAYATAGAFDPRAHRGTLAGLRSFVGLAGDRRIGDDALSLVRRDGYDVVVVDTIASGGLAALQDAGLAPVVLLHLFLGYFERLRRGPVGLLARLRGISMVRVQAAAPMRIVCARPELDPVRGPADNARHVGAIWQGTPVEAVATEPPTVLVSLSTTAFPGQAKTLQAVLDAIATLPVHAVVTTGPTLDPATFTIPANATIHAWLDHSEVLPRASLVIGHGGHSTAMRALSYGVPMLILPSHQLLDQPMVGAALERARLGALLRGRRTPERIAAAARSLLGDEGVRSAAQQVGASIRQRDGAEAAADLIESLN